MVYTGGNITKEMFYAANIVYDGSHLNHILTTEGRIRKEESVFKFEYFIKDHLGNVRVVFGDNGSGNAELLQEDHYYPYGMTLGGLSYNAGVPHNKYQYNGKEIQAGHNLNWYAYGFRMMDPQLGRWHVVDAMAENNITTSPYAYVQNNPVNYIDLLGLDRLGFDKHESGGPVWMSSMIYKFTSNAYQEGGVFFSGGTSADYDRYSKEKAKGEDGSVKDGQSFGEWYTEQVRGINTKNENSDDSENEEEKDKKGEGEVKKDDSENNKYFLLPVAKALSIDLDFFFGSGGDVKCIGYIIILQGPDAGEIKRFSDAGGGGGMDVSGALAETNFWYTGNIDNFGIQTFQQPRVEFNIAASFVADIGLSLSVSKKDIYGGRLIGTTASAGFGYLPWIISGNVNYGTTKIFNK